MVSMEPSQDQGRGVGGRKGVVLLTCQRAAATPHLGWPVSQTLRPWRRGAPPPTCVCQALWALHMPCPVQVTL